VLELVLSARQEFLTRAKAFEARAIARVIQFAVKTSTNLSRTVLLGLAALIFLPTVPERIDVAVLPSSVMPANPLPAATTSPIEEKSTPTSPDEAKINPAAPSPPTPSIQISESKSAPAKPPPVPLPPAKQLAPLWTDDQVATAKAVCSKLLDNIPVITESLPPARQGICGAPAPRELRSIGKEDKVAFHPPATLRCPMIAALNTWVSDKLQPSAKKHFGVSIARIVSGSYSCRNRYGLARAPISEHALMNAIDISAFVLENGKVIRVSTGWKMPHEKKRDDSAKADAAHGKRDKNHKIAASKLGAHDLAPRDDGDKVKANDSKNESKKDAKEDPKIAASEFLHEAHDSACAIFGTILGPDTNAAHHDHLHLDMKARKYHSICQ
jgi:hypothetical protein